MSKNTGKFHAGKEFLKIFLAAHPESIFGDGFGRVLGVLSFEKNDVGAVFQFFGGQPQIERFEVLKSKYCFAVGGFDSCLVGLIFNSGFRRS